MQRKEQNEHGKRGDGGTGHHRGEQRFVSKLELLQTHLNGVHGRVVGHQERPEEVVPAGHEGVDRHDRQHGFGQGQDDFDKDLELIAALNLGALDQRRGQAGEELLAQENVVGRAQAGQNHGRIGVGHREFLHHQDVQRNLGHLIGNHHSHQNQAEQNLAALEPDLGESIARHGGKNHVADDRPRRHNHAVENPPQGMIAEMEERVKGFQRKPGRQDRAHIARRGHVGAEGRENHVADGEQRRRRQNDQDDGDDRIAEVKHLPVVQVLGIQTGSSHNPPP